MADTLKHRGPDSAHYYKSKDEHISIGNLSLQANKDHKNEPQLFINQDQNVILTFDGFISNASELRDELSQEYDFQTQENAEVVLAGYQKWGIDVLIYLRGLFAFAIYDKKQEQIFLIRDHFGIKPLYYTIQNEQLLFASELKAILASEQIERKINFSSFADFFVYRYIPSPKTIWKNIQKLPPAHYAVINTRDLSIQIKEYWVLDAIYQHHEYVEGKVHDLLENSVKQFTDLHDTVGSFLSGGYDSSALVMYMKQLGFNPETFSIGFSNWPKSEDQFAKIVAEHLGVPNESLVADEKSLELIDLMPEVYDEPIADISIIPTYMVSQLASVKVKAVLSGEGADELFAGYNWQREFYNKHNPKGLFNKIKQKLKSKEDTVAYYAQAMAMGWFDQEELKSMLHPDLHAHIPEDVHWFYRQHYQSHLTPLKAIQYMDIKCFMGELVLTKIDRGSMANSLEVRTPFLDVELYDYVFQLEEEDYYKEEQTKYLLYKHIKDHLPASILERKKQGFVGPDDYYMDIDWYKEQLKDSQMVKMNLVNQEYIDALLQETYNWKLWKLVVMEKWVRTWL